MRSAVRQAWRALAARPALTLGLTLTLALGVGANAAMLGALDALLLRLPAHVEDPDGRLVRVWFRTAPRDGDEGGTSDRSSYPGFALLRDSARTLDAAAAVADYEVPLAIDPRGAADGATHPARAVSPSFFAMLGVRPALGRWPDAADDRADVATTSVVLGDALWRTRFGADPAVLGREVRIGTLRARIVGVAPPRFAGTDWARVALWLPIEPATRAFGWSEALTSAGSYWLQIVARRAPAASPAQVDAELTPRWRAWRLATDPADSARIARQSIVVGPLPIGRSPGGNEGGLLALLLAGTAGALLLAALANASGLLLARAIERRGEMAVRRALGARPRDLLRAVLAESALLALGSATLAAVVALATGALVRRHLLTEPFAELPLLDGRRAALLVALAVGTCLVAATAAAWLAARATPARDALGGTLTGAGRGAVPAVRRTLGALVGAQVAAACVLAYGAMLFTASLQRALGARTGYDVPRVLDVALGGDDNAFTSVAARRAYARAMRRAAALPGVEGVALASQRLLYSASALSIEVPGRGTVPQQPGGGPYFTVVSEGYFAVSGTRLLAGRAPRPPALDSAGRLAGPREIVVSALAARVLWPDGSPLGQCALIGDAKTCSTVVGVAEDARRFGLEEDAAMHLYLGAITEGHERALAAAGERDHALTDPEALLVRVAGDASSRAEEIARAIRAELPGLTVTVEPLAARMERSYQPWRAGVALVGSFAALAVAVTAAGLFGAVSYALARRRREVGVRLALGAPVRHVVALLARAGLGPVVGGLVVGAGLAALAGRVLATLLYETSPAEPRVVLPASVALVVVAGAACWLPARRAARVDPVDVLRAE